MRFYLSSYKLGDHPERLRALFAANTNVGYISNALDFTHGDAQKIQRHRAEDLHLLSEIGLSPQEIDLRTFFGKKHALQSHLETVGGLWISGGSVFILRQAMKLSGLDELLAENVFPETFVYGGYSAAGCVLAPTLRAYAIVDDPTELPYPRQQTVIWEGLGLLDFALLPHYQSDHSESADIDKEVQNCIDHTIPFQTLRDGEVLIL